MDSTTLTDRPSIAVAWWRAPFTAAPWLGLLYLLLSLPVGLFGVWVLAAGLIGSVFLALFLVGFALLPLTLALVRWATGLELARARRMLGLPLSEPRRDPPRPSGMLRRFRARLADRQTWRDITYVLASFPLSLVFATVLFLIPVFLYRAVTYPFIALFDDASYVTDWGGPTYIGAVLVHTGQGFLLLFLTPFVVRALTRLHGSLVARLLAARPRATTSTVTGGPGRL